MSLLRPRDDACGVYEGPIQTRRVLEASKCRNPSPHPLKRIWRVPEGAVQIEREEGGMGKEEGFRPMPSLRQTERRRNMAVRRRPSYSSRVGAAGQILLQGRLVADGREVRVGLCLLCCQTFLHNVGQRGVAQRRDGEYCGRADDTYRMVVPQQLVQEVDGLVADEPLVLRVDEAVPGLLLEAAQDVVVLGVELYLVLVQVVEQVVSAEDLGDLDELVGVAVSVEEGLLAEDHGRKHGAKTPHVEAVVVLLEIDEQLGALEVARRDADVVLGAGVVELGETPVDEA